MPADRLPTPLAARERGLLRSGQPSGKLLQQVPAERNPLRAGTRLCWGDLGPQYRRGGQAECIPGSHETRELVWELQQPRPDAHRVRYLIESAADVALAMRMANLSEMDISRRPALRQLHLSRYIKKA